MYKTKTASEIRKKVNFYEICSEELKKWADLRNTNIITEEEYQEKKEKGQYVKNALSSISFVVELIYNNATISDFSHDNWYEFVFKTYSIATGVDVKSGWGGLVAEELTGVSPPQIKLKDWLELRNLNAITEEEYQKLKEEFLKVVGVNKESDIREEIQSWSRLRDLNAITEEEFQKLKVYLLDSDLKPNKKE